MFKKPWSLYRVGGLLLILLLAPACVGASAPPEETPMTAEATATPEPTGRGVGDTLNLLSWEAPVTLNPHLSSASKDFFAGRLCYEPLASFDKDDKLVPILATEIPTRENGGIAEDLKSVTWKLKPGIKWSDGEHELTAEDVAFTFGFLSNPDVGADSSFLYEPVERVEVIDRLTIRIHFKRVTPAWSEIFTGQWGVILPTHAFEAYNGANAREAPANTTNPVCTGPYQVVKFKTEEVLFLGTNLIQTNRIIYEPNPFFREEDKPFFRRVELKGGGLVGEAARAVLRTGEVDYAIALTVDPTLLDELQTGGRGQVHTIGAQSVQQIALNRTDPNKETADGEVSSLEFPHPFFSDLRVRQAFTYAVDRDGIGEVYGVTARPISNNLVAPAIYNSPNTSYEFNLEKAKALLDEAGWVDSDRDGVRDKDGVKMKVVYQGQVSTTVQKTQALIQEALESIGVEVELKLVDPSNYWNSDIADNVWRFQADMEEYNLGGVSPDPNLYMQVWICDQIPQKANGWSGLNFQRWCDPKYDELYRQSTVEVDPEKRRQLFIEMNDIQINDVVMIPLLQTVYVAGASRSLEGVDLTPWDADIWNIKDWRRISP
jgi:peptide/nickel transport system substrate-binding protein